MKALLIGAIIAVLSLPTSAKDREIWTPRPALVQIQYSSLWCMSNYEKSTLGRVRHTCVIGTKKPSNSGFVIDAIATFPKRDGVIYDWKLEGDNLVVSDKRSREVIAKLNVKSYLLSVPTETKVPQE